MFLPSILHEQEWVDNVDNMFPRCQHGLRLPYFTPPLDILILAMDFFNVCLRQLSAKGILAKETLKGNIPLREYKSTPQSAVFSALNLNCKFICC